MKNCGLVSISFRKYSPERIIEEMKKAKLHFIEWGSDIHAPRDDRETLLNISALQAENGITCCSYGTYFRLGTDNTDILQEYIDAAKILGTDILRLWCGDKATDKYSPEEEDFLFDECKKASDIAEKNGVILCLECHNGTYTETKEGAIKLMKNISSPSFRMYWQPNQFKSADENMSYARLLSPFTKTLHVFNWTEDKRFPLADAVPLWKEYLSYFYEPMLLLEFMPDDDIASLCKEAEALRKITE